MIYLCPVCGLELTLNPISFLTVQWSRGVSLPGRAHAIPPALWLVGVSPILAGITDARTRKSSIQASFLDLQLSVSNEIVSTKIYVMILIFSFLDGGVPRSTSYGVI